MITALDNLSEKNKGIIFVFSGLILLFHTLGIIETGLNYIIIIGSLFMIAYGLVLIDIQKKILKLLKKKKESE